MNSSSRITDEEATAFFSKCVIDALIPLSSEIDLNTILELAQSACTDNDDASLSAKVPQRESIFFDERIATSVVLRCPLLDEAAFTDLLSRITINLEAYVVGTRHGSEAQDQQKSSVKDLVDSQALQGNDDPVIAVEANNEQEDSEAINPFSRHIYVQWKQEVHIARNHIRSTNPSLYLSTALKLRPENESADPDDPYLTPFEPESFNLFDALHYDPSFKGKKAPVLSAVRLSKHTPTGAAVREQTRPLKNLTRTLHKLVPAVDTRLRCTRLGGAGKTGTKATKILAQIEVETAPTISTLGEDTSLYLEKMTLDLEHGQANPVPGIDLPRLCAARDILSFVYDLVPDQSNQTLRVRRQGKDSQRHILSLNLQANVQPVDEPSKDQHKIMTKWRTTLDLSPLYDSNPDGFDHALQDSVHPLLISIQGSKGPIRVDEELTWMVSVSNTSDSPARLIRAKIEPLFEQPDEKPGIISMKPYLTTHKLPPGSSTTVRLEFKVLGVGVLTACPLRVVELDEDGHEVEGTSTTIPPKNLPDVVVLPLNTDW